MATVLGRDFPGAPQGAEDRATVVELMRAALWRARAEGRPISALVVSHDSQARVERRYGKPGLGTALLWIAERVVEWADPTELFGLREGKRFFVLLSGTSTADAEELARGLIEAAHGGALLLDGEPQHLRLSAGVGDGNRTGELYLETLLEVALEGSLVAAAGGGNRCVHTEVYESLQARFDAELPEEAKRAPEPEPESEPRDDAPAPAAPEPEAPAPVEAELPEDVEIVLTEELTAFTQTDLSRSERDVVDLAVQRAKRAWSDAAGELMARHDAEIARLERRIKKLNAALAEAEAEVSRSRSRTPVETGVASAFKSVQGLSEAEENYVLKRELMGMIFDANVALRRELGGR